MKNLVVKGSHHCCRRLIEQGWEQTCPPFQAVALTLWLTRAISSQLRQGFWQILLDNVLAK